MPAPPTVKGRRQLPRLATLLHQSLAARAKALCVGDVSVALHETLGTQLSLLPRLEGVRLETLLGNGRWGEHLRTAAGDGPGPRVVAFLSAAFLLGDAPPFSALIQTALHAEFSVCASAGDTDILAWAHAWPVCNDWPSLAMDLLRAITTTHTGHQLDDLRARVAPSGWIRPDRDSANSPALVGLPGRTSLRRGDALPYVNQALYETLEYHPFTSVHEHDPIRMLRDELVDLRDQSRVPWVFNELANDLEYRHAETTPASYPTEVHLSLTGACNLECKFCSYDHRLARYQYVTPDQVARLEFLRYVRTLRLHSGLGDPTLNRQLPEIIGSVRHNYPHVAMNFFTNGVALGRGDLIRQLVDSGVEWINISLNAASAGSWRALCGADHFQRVCANVLALHEAKRARRALHPLVYGSMVLTRNSVRELPRMPALCRELGIDRFTAIPFFGLGYAAAGRLTGDDSYHHVSEEYDALYWETVVAARTHQVSLEIPAPSIKRATAFGLEVRPLYDFAGIETNGAQLAKLLCAVQLPPRGMYCHFPWQIAAIGSSDRTHGPTAASHYLYPCLGPLARANLASTTPFNFPKHSEDFMALWRNELFSKLRQAQTREGVSRVCDACRTCDSRDPHNLIRLERLVDEFAEENGLPPVTGAPAQPAVYDSSNGSSTS